MLDDDHWSSRTLEGEFIFKPVKSALATIAGVTTTNVQLIYVYVRQLDNIVKRVTGPVVCTVRGWVDVACGDGKSRSRFNLKMLDCVALIFELC